MTVERIAAADDHERRLSDRLDFYKLTMGQLALAHHPDTEVTFTFKNRGSEQLNRYVDPTLLAANLAVISEQGFKDDEVDYYRSLTAADGSSRFNETYLDYLSHTDLPKATVTPNPMTGDFDIQATGPWASVSLLETVVMSEVNQQYFEGLIKAEGLSLDAIYEEGDRRLDEKIARLKERPDIKFADFGTRRRFNHDWHTHVVGRLTAELPDNLVGTSNPWLARTYDIPPVGTYAHEMPMVYSALEDNSTGRPLDGHRKMLDDWQHYYKGDLSIALTDTFTTDFFFKDFGEHGAKTWKGLRHDSGDPYEFGERAIEFYEQYDIDPNERVVVFSDGLDIDEIFRLTDYFEGRIQLLFGWGTTLTNDLGLKPLNIVMKATEADTMPTVKLGDDDGKQTGPTETVERYKHDVRLFLGRAPVMEMVAV